MHDRLKTYFTRYSGTVYIMLAILIIACGWFIFGGGNDSDHKRAVEHMERVKEEQRNSLELNQAVKTSIERSAQLNQQASERIVRAQEYQQQTVARIDEGTKRLDQAAAILERNERLIERVEQGHQAQSPNGTATTSPKKYMGTD
ncbi:hypothetical protein [Veillonella sp. VA137]|uniref:hypothetical protein n=1 Tax=Veillonella sp. VA137 TaxID=741828 RepID=UPI000F8D607A|nr:hypothetical protein [Veillonella sp. VA137]